MHIFKGVVAIAFPLDDIAKEKQLLQKKQNIRSCWEVALI